MGNNEVTLMKCKLFYPAPIEEANMCMSKDFSVRFNVITGLSDHIIGATVPLVATCFGSKIIEKHYILDRSIGVPDAVCTMNDQEFTEMVKAVMEIGIVDYEVTDKQLKGKDFIRDKNICSIRSRYSLYSKYYYEILGIKVNRELEKGERLSFYMIENNA